MEIRWSRCKEPCSCCRGLLEQDASLLQRDSDVAPEVRASADDDSSPDYTVRPNIKIHNIGELLKTPRQIIDR
ncbi:hypothetical protein EYF80_060140 [Liparis tanakae]|uniref:Uncharacterized protein n=1 Tax=Liparis tanakae TaxID=230148 RepID=A0A4Z2EMB7_9TELE|nr:hypothetical protein EYF80_060140 [Liparis tanakae]